MEIKNRTIFLYDMSTFGSVSSLSEYLKLLDLLGNTFVYFYENGTRMSENSSIKTIKFTNTEIFESIKNNSFRCDFILIEPQSIEWCLSNLKKIELPIIYVKNTNTPEKYKNWDETLFFNAEPYSYNTISSLSYLRNDEERLKHYTVTDMKTNIKTNMLDTIKKHQRKEKLKSILGTSSQN